MSASRSYPALAELVAKLKTTVLEANMGPPAPGRTAVSMSLEDHVAVAELIEAADRALEADAESSESERVRVPVPGVRLVTMSREYRACLDAADAAWEAFRADVRAKTSPLFATEAETVGHAVLYWLLRYSGLVVPETTAARLRGHVAALQRGRSVTCVYCGHEYGPDPGTPRAQADVLKDHIERCPDHPMAALREQLEALIATHGAARSLLERCRDFAHETPGSWKTSELRDEVASFLTRGAADLLHAMADWFYAQDERGDETLEDLAERDPALARQRELADKVADLRDLLRAAGRYVEGGGVVGDALWLAAPELLARIREAVKV